MELPFTPPLDPMLAKLARELPGDGFLYEPKWDGFRCVVFRSTGDIDLRSRNGRPLARYFPELVDALGRLAPSLVLDAEILAVTVVGIDFSALLSRLHPARSRVERLSREAPAILVAFDLLALGGEDLRGLPFAKRRKLLARTLAKAHPPIYTTPVTDDPGVAERWLGRVYDGIDGVVAKEPGLRYHSGKRAMLKVKRELTADCVVAGFRLFEDRPLPSSLLLGLYASDGTLRQVGLASSFAEHERPAILETLRPHMTGLEGHPWERGFLEAGSPMGRLRGAAARWSPDEMSLDWVPLEPRLVCEVSFDQLDRDRFRHPARFRRWRPDRDPRSCTFEQFELHRADPRELLA
jgi:ATP-dependent DNA ligase